MPVGPHQETGADIQDFTILDRDLLVLPVTSLTRNGNNLITQVVRSGAGGDGLTYTVTDNYTRDGAGRVTQVQRTMTGGGGQRVETWTVNRDANHRVTDTPVTRT